MAKSELYCLIAVTVFETMDDYSMFASCRKRAGSYADSGQKVETSPLDSLVENSCRTASQVDLCFHHSNEPYSAVSFRGSSRVASTSFFQRRHSNLQSSSVVHPNLTSSRMFLPRPDFS